MSALPVLAGKDLISFDDEKLKLIRNVIAKDLNQLEFELFIAVAKARGLDPVLGQIHAVKRDGKVVFQVGIDGGRLIAARTGEYAGSDRPEYERNEQGEIMTAIVTVHRFVQGQRVAFTGVAYWDEFYPGDKQGFMWKKMPHSQLAKCAEMQALRKGFPNDLGGLYAPEELEREIVDATIAPPAGLAEPKAALEKDINEIMKKFRRIGVTEQMVKDKYAIDDILELTEERLKDLNDIGAAIVKKEKTKEEAFTPAEEF